MTRISSLDDTYTKGALSSFSSSSRKSITDKKTTDSKDTLYTAANNAETKLKTGLSYNGKMIIVEDASKFPSSGLVRIGSTGISQGPAELIYYGSRTNDTFKDLVRGFAGSRQNQWDSGSYATNSVTAEPHNAIKDALINIESRVGLKNNPESGTLNQRLKTLEARYLAPKSSFRAYPRIGAPSLTVRFQNFSEGDVARYLWDFGDGTQTIDKNPNHTYTKEGIYTVKLNVITSTGAQGVSTKTEYITVLNSEKPSYFYSNTNAGYSIDYSISNGYEPTTFVFTDQTDGDIKERIWIFGDGSESIIQKDPNTHDISYVYQSKGEYQPALLIIFADENLKRIFLTKKVTVQ